MALLDHPDAQALLGDATLSVEPRQELGPRRQPFLQRYLPLFQRAEQRRHAFARTRAVASAKKPFAEAQSVRPLAGSARLLPALPAKAAAVPNSGPAPLTGDRS